jgi:hypothetical protein
MTVMMIRAKVKCEQVDNTCLHRHRLRCLAAQPARRHLRQIENRRT